MATVLAGLSLLGWFALAPAPDAPAPPLPLTLEWRAPAGCPDAPAVTDMVHALLRRRALQAPADALVARADVAQAGRHGWDLRLELRSARGHMERRLRAETCLLLARAAALVIGVHLDPLAVRRNLDAPTPVPPAPVSPAPDPVLPAPDPVPPVLPDPVAPVLPAPVAPVPDAPAPAPVSPLAPVTPAGAPVTPGPAPAPRIAALIDLSPETAAPTPPASPIPRLAGHLRLDGGLDYGVLPGLGGGGGLFGGLTLPHLRLEAGLLGVPLRIQRTPEGDAGGRLHRLTAVLRLCPGWRVPRDRDLAAIFLCAAIEAGGVYAAGLDVARPNPQWAPWAGLSLGPAARVALAGPLGLWFGAEAVIALSRPIFTLGPDEQQLLQLGRAGLRLNFGLDLQFAARKL